MIVADTNLIGYLLLASEHSALAEDVFRLDPVWAAPLLWRSELRNVLALYNRRSLLSLDDATGIMDTAVDLIGDNEYSVGSRDVLRLAEQSGSSAYDCEFVALAMNLRVQLVTSDRALLRNFSATAVSPATFAGSMDR